MNNNTININVNGEARSVDANLTVKGLIDLLDLSEQRLAVEVNREIVPRSEHVQHHLNEGDRVEIVRAIGGGESRVSASRV